MHHVLYFNGLGEGKLRRREIAAFRYLAKHGIEVTHMHIDWFSGEPFPKILERAVAKTREQLQKHGNVTLVGSSAGGCIALNVFGVLHDQKKLRAVSLCGRLQEGNIPEGSRSSLRRRAYLDTDRPSQSFFDAVKYCETVTVPQLTDEAKQRITVVKQLADGIVPRKTMDIKGVRTRLVPGFGHGMGIALAVLILPSITRDTIG